MTKSLMFGISALLIIALAGCSPDYSPNTYNGSAVQQANKVDTGVVIGYREVRISDDGTVGTVTGGAAGGILGAEVGPPAVPGALAALGGTVVGGLVGATLQHASGDTKGWEYIVREPKGDLVSVTQREPTPIAIGQHVLVIEGKQARIIPDYATASFDEPTPAAKADPKHDQEKAAQERAAAAAPPPPAEPVTPTPAAATTAAPAPVPAAAPAATPASATNDAAPAAPSSDASKASSDLPAAANTPAAAPAQPTPPSSTEATSPPAASGAPASP